MKKSMVKKTKKNNKNKKKQQIAKHLLRVWRNECARVFGDRLISEEDRSVIAVGCYFYY